jgi:SAM-dependent methyltransferase
MHDTAKFYGERFLDVYSPAIKNLSATVPLVLEVGAGDDATFKNKCAELGLNYQGMDQIHSPDPDAVYRLPAMDNSVDMVVSSSCFEHDEFFWITFLEIMRVLKPHGVFYLSAPSDGVYHTYPVDCWRFYPDAANALVKWANKNRIPAMVMESFTGTPVADIWKDYMGIFLKDKSFLASYPNRILDNLQHKVTNARRHRA